MPTAIKNSKFPWRLFRLYLVIGIIGAVCSLPFMMSLMTKVSEKSAETLPLPLPLILVLGIVQQTITLALLTGFGLWFAGKIGLSEPLFEKWIGGESVRRDFISTLRISVFMGGAAGVIISLLQIFVFLPFLPRLPIADAAALPVWIRFGACFGGLVEEIVMRLFLMSLVAWLLAKIWKDSRIERVMWTANLVVALIFGLLHLPTAALFLPITPLVVVAAIVLNGLAGIAFGYLYWKRGLTAAMLAHFVCNIFVWVIAPEFI